MPTYECMHNHLIFSFQTTANLQTYLCSHNGPYRHTIFDNICPALSFHSPNHQLWFCAHQCGKCWCIQALRTFWCSGRLHNHRCISLPRCFLEVRCLCICTATHTASQHSHSPCLCRNLHTWRRRHPNERWSLINWQHEMHFAFVMKNRIHRIEISCYLPFSPTHHSGVLFLKLLNSPSMSSLSKSL